MSPASPTALKRVTLNQNQGYSGVYRSRIRTTGWTPGDSSMVFVDIQDKVVPDALHGNELTDTLELLVGPVGIFILDISTLDELRST